MTYKIVRVYNRRKPLTIKKGLSFEQAIQHCMNKQSAWTTCTTTRGKNRTNKFGIWVDSYAREE